MPSRPFRGNSVRMLSAVNPLKGRSHNLFAHINITSAGAVDREFVNIYWAQMGPNFIQLGSNWIQIGSNWAPIVFHLDPFGCHWPLWGPMGCQARFGNLASPEVRSGRTRSAFWELATGPTGMAEVVARTVARTPHSTFHTRRGPG